MKSTVEDPYQWLEDVEGDAVINWVKDFNEKSTNELKGNPSYEEIHQDIRNIIFAKDRIPFAEFQDGYFWNFWEDETYKHGILRRCTVEEYKKESPTWEIKMDLDKLSEEENENWVYSSRDTFERHCSLGYLALSRGGKDAVVIREFDFERGEFIKENAFFVAEAKTDITPFDRNHLFIGSDFGEGSLTTSGYPRVIKVWQRSHPLEKAATVFEGESSDVSVSASIVRDYLANEQHILFYRAIDFFNHEIFFQQTLPLNMASTKVADQLATNCSVLRKLPIPSTAALLSIRSRYMYIRLKEPLILTEGEREINFPNNSILRSRLEEGSLINAEIIFSATEGQSVEDVTVWTDRLFVTVLENVRSRVLDIRLCSDSVEWETTNLPLPTTGMISLSLRYEDEPHSDLTLMTYSDHLTPYSQYLLHSVENYAMTGSAFQIELLKTSPHRFDASQFEVLQHFVTSKDGFTRVPYFLIQRKDLEANGNHPTILYGYGGFEISLTPHYSGVIGKAWLERGGVYVIANIRGGGEFGPAWHQAALKTKRQVAYDDFYAVAEDLIARNITSPRHLGINGGSNGGLLVGVAMIQRPELFNAVLIQVPLLDMLRFHHLLAGASWIGEYGDPDKEEDLAFLRTISPYHNVKRYGEVKYPKALLTTSTKDDRVHPAHARKMVARLTEYGHPLLYYENINGGHAGSANLDEYAFMRALEYTYMWEQLA